MRKIHVLLSFWKTFSYLSWLILHLILESWVLNLESWSWFLELESWNLILDSWNQTSIWTLKCSWFNLELILWFLRSSSLLSWSVLDFWAFCHHLYYHQNSLNQFWFIMKLASTDSTMAIDEAYTVCYFFFFFFFCFLPRVRIDILTMGQGLW